MKRLDCIQGSDAWARARMGIPTASEFSKIITPKKWEPTKGETRRAYQIYLLTELMLDMPLVGVTTASMNHGHAWEPKARAAYEMLTGCDVELVGFCTTDDGLVGASPDSLVGAEGSLEIKSPQKPEIHVDYLVNPEGLKDEYFVQVQGQLFVTGRKWTDLISYFSGLPMVTIRVEPELEFQQKLAACLREFTCELADLIERAKKNGWIPDKRQVLTYESDWLTEKDVDQIIVARNRQQPIPVSVA